MSPLLAQSGHGDRLNQFLLLGGGVKRTLRTSLDGKARWIARQADGVSTPKVPVPSGFAFWLLIHHARARLSSRRVDYQQTYPAPKDRWRVHECRQRHLALSWNSRRLTNGNTPLHVPFGTSTLSSARAGPYCGRTK